MAGRGGAPPAIRTRGIVVGHVDLGERDRIVRLLTPDHGRVGALARGVRGSRKRFGGALDTGNQVDIGLRPGRGDLWHLDDAELVEGRDGARRDLTRLTLLAYACELCSGLSRDDHPEPRLYGLLEMAALLLDAMTAPPSVAFRIGLEGKALSFAGLAPRLLTCVSCGEALAPEEEEGADEGEGWSLQPHKGGAVHAHCAPGLRRVSPAWLRAAEHARRTPLRDLVDLPFPDGPSWALAELAESHMQRALKARSVLAALEPAPQGAHGPGGAAPADRRDRDPA